MKKFMRELILQTEDNRISYKKFISYALYHPQYGYYTSQKEKIGKEGDFYTSSVVHEIFAEMFAQYFVKLSKELEIPLTICEIGGGDGRFANQVLNKLDKQFITNVTYYFIEASEDHRKRAIEKQKDSWDFQVFSSIDSFMKQKGSFEGFVFSNEWLDAQPVDVIIKNNGEIFDISITYNDEKDEFEEVYVPSSKSTINWIKEHEINLKENQRFELAVYMEDCALSLNRLLHKGVITTVDYGYTNEELIHPSRREGSLRGYFNHKLQHNVLEHIGEMDITHHVQWDNWIRIGKAYGLHFVEKLRQGEFLLQLGILDELVQHNVTNPFSKEHKKNRAIRSFIMGEGFSEAFDVCIQTKNIEKKKVFDAYKKPGSNS